MHMCTFTALQRPSAPWCTAARYLYNGIGYKKSLVVMNPGSLRYPGGEKSDSCAWTPHCPFPLSAT